MMEDPSLSSLRICSDPVLTSEAHLAFCRIDRFKQWHSNAPQRAGFMYTYRTHDVRKKPFEKGRARARHNNASFILTSTIFSLLHFPSFFCHLPQSIMQLPSLPKANWMHAIFLERVRLFSASFGWHYPKYDQTQTKDINKKGVHLFPYCKISRRYFPVVLLHIPLFEPLEGSV